MRGFAAWLSLFTSAGTLVCCALPSLFVVLGMGATMAGFVSSFPQIIWLSKYKAWVFGFSAFMLLFSAIMQYRSRNEPCPIDPVQALACTRGRVWSFRILLFSVLIWSLGAFFAFLAPYIFN